MLLCFKKGLMGKIESIGQAIR